LISALQIQNALENNVEAITEILVKLGVPEETIKYNESKHLITSVRPDKNADNRAGCLVYTDSLYYMYTTRTGKGSLFSLIMDVKGCNFPRSLEYVTQWTGVEGKRIEIKYPFGGFYRKFLRSDKRLGDILLDEYSEDDLPEETALSQQFFEDGISFKCQEEWGIRYDLDGNNILIPIRDSLGRLVGCKARRGDPSVPHDKRWFAYLPYSKTSVVYGYDRNYKSIQDKSLAVIFEAEKSVLQTASFDFPYSLAIGGHNISDVQERYIKSLMTDRIIIAFDADLPQEELDYWAHKLKSNKVLKNKVGYIYDKNHDLLGEKDSPSDHGYKVFKELMKNYVIWV